MNREDELFIAKKTAERAGYKVTMPKSARPVPHAASSQLSRLAQAARTAEEAGYSVRKMTPIEQAKHTAEEAGYTVRPAPTRSGLGCRQIPVDKQKSAEKDFPSYMQNAVKFMPPKEDE